MFESASRCRPTRSRQQSRRATRRIGACPGPGDGSSTGFQPVSSQMGHGIGESRRAGLRLLIQMAPQFRGAAELFFGPRLDLPHALARQVQAIPDLLQRVRLVVVEAEAQADDLALLAVQIAQRLSELVEV